MIMLRCFLFLALFSFVCRSEQGEFEQCACDKIDLEFSKLQWVNSYANEMVEGVFYKRVEPRKMLPSKDLLYFNNDVAKLLDLNLEEYLEDDHCKAVLLEYLAFEKRIPGSDPISVPHSEYRYLEQEENKDIYASLLPERNGGILLGTIATKSGQNLDLFIKGVSNVPFAGISNGELTLQDSLFELITSTTVNATGVQTVQNLALIVSHEAYIDHSGRESNVLLLQVAPTFLRLGSIEYFANNNKVVEAQTVLSYVQRHYFPTVMLHEDIYNHCAEDDDDDEEDDDEYCYRTGTNVVLTEMAASFYGNALNIGYKNYQSGLISSGTFAVDGTMLEFPMSRFKEFGDVDIMNCGSDSLRNGNGFPYEQYSLLRKSLYAQLAEKLGLPHYISKDINKAVRNRFYEAELQHMNQRVGVMGSNMDAFATLKALEINRKVSRHVDWMIFFQELGNILPTSTTKQPRETSLDETIWRAIHTEDLSEFATWIDWLQNYREIVRKQPLSPEDRKQFVQNYHPAFLPRSREIIQAIKGVESNSTELLHQLLHHAKDPFNPNFPKEWDRAGRVMIFSCSNENKVADASTIKRQRVYHKV